MNSSSRKIVFGAAVFCSTVLLAITGYWWAGWSLIEACYMVVITIFGVGYGEVRPIDHPLLRVFTIGFIVTGCTSAAYVVGGFAQMIAEGELNKALGARRMSEGLKRLSNHVIICGYGRVGQILGAELRQAGRDYVLVDTNRERLLEAEAEGACIVVGDATEEEILRAAGVERAQSLACVLPNDAINVFITLTARELNEQLEIIARAESPSTRRKLLRSGANRVVLPAAVGANKIAHLILRPSAEDLLSGADYENRLNDELQHLGLKLHEFPIAAHSELIGQPIDNVEVVSHRGVVIVALRRKDETVISDPPAATLMMDGDVVILLGHRDSPVTLQRSSKSRLMYRGVKVN